ncbi:uncharacterized protein LOC132698142 [Cylas formicarius]|uniref:uncharacterized protein LOC132698142 n=1 Tax=Cylas formicarius TaxID=197179 RepID=UPI002958A849|nr:uncharacterized protein LOC132698142 [Cylas formicarius]
MFTKGLFPGILITALSFASVKCRDENHVVYISDEIWRTETPLRCYDCNSEFDPRCADPFNDYTIGIVNCSELKPPEHLINFDQHPNDKLKPTVCRKIVQKIQGKTRVIRECGYIQDTYDDKNCALRSGTKDVQLIYCSCTKSLCNLGHAAIRPSPLLLGLIFAVLMIVSLKMRK